jgi:hypothetical protein
LACSEGAKLITGPNDFHREQQDADLPGEDLRTGSWRSRRSATTTTPSGSRRIRGLQQSRIVRETHKMMLDHYQQTKTC